MRTSKILKLSFLETSHILEDTYKNDIGHPDEF